MRFRQIRGVKHSVFTKNTEWNGAFLAITLYLRKSSYVLGFNTYLTKFLKFWASDLSIIERCQKIVKTNYKISCMCTFKMLYIAKHCTIFDIGWIDYFLARNRHRYSKLVPAQRDWSAASSHRNTVQNVQDSRYLFSNLALEISWKLT
jgi:hypothetical protein